jgi:probable FeS assembly SUF system protein SufT
MSSSCRRAIASPCPPAAWATSPRHSAAASPCSSKATCSGSRGQDADAIGKEAPQPLELPEGAGDADVEVLAWQQLRTCFDPEIPINVVELGLVYACEIQRADDGSRRIEVKMTLTAPGCGMGEVLVEDVRSKLELIPTVSDADVELVFDPPWNQGMMSEVARLETGMF